MVLEVGSGGSPAKKKGEYLFSLHFHVDDRMCDYFGLTTEKLL